MTTKEKVLQALELNRGISISGQELAEQLQVSRAAIWKTIEELRKEGYVINAMTNKGYSLDSETDVLSVQGILPHLKNHDAQGIFVYKTLESTNQTAKKMALEGASHGTVVLSEEQTKGKGRLGRSFFSPASSGIYMSLILKPNFDVTKSVLITTAASVAVCRAMEKVLGIQGEIKWVNDIYVGGKKVCGILTEAVTHFETGQIEYLVLGIGINVSTPEEDFPSEIKGVASSLLGSRQEATHLKEKSRLSGISRNQLAAAVINEMMAIYEEMDARKFMAEYRSRSMILGREIRVIPSGTVDISEALARSPVAEAIDIDENGGLVVRYEDGRKDTLSSGEISIRLA